MVATRLFLTVTMCLIYMPLLPASFLTNSQSAKRFDESAGSQRRSVLEGSRLFFKEQLPSETVATKNDNFILTCEARGQPPATIHWLKNGVRIMQDASHTTGDNEVPSGVSGSTMMLSSTRSKLYLDCLSEYNAGEYTCVAVNAANSISQSTTLRVERGNHVNPACSGDISPTGKPARIYMWTVNRLEYENNKVQLFCRAEGYPTPTITWKDRNNTPIANNENYRVAQNGDLIIERVTWQENMGAYTCIADNRRGTDTATTFLYPTREG